MVPLGLDRQFKWVILAGGVVNLVLAVALTPRFAQLGMTAAVVATEVFVVYALYLTLRCRKLSPLAATRMDQA
jgi:O-antigen/teichoic acid export membrane protein